VEIRVAARTDVGRVREGNEDAFLIRHPLYAIADGMGGHLGGEVASALAVETVAADAGGRPLAERVLEANRAVLERSKGDRAVAGMGTTFTGIELHDGVARLAHVGDSRAYRFRGGALEPLTEDHTLVGELVRSGDLDEAAARAHPQRSVLLRCIGTEATVEVDEGLVELADGDRLLLCSDGLTEMLDSGAVAAILGETAGDPDAAADRLVAAANDAGGTDNITVIVLDVVEAAP
jgi:protein phosphatase